MSNPWNFCSFHIIFQMIMLISLSITFFKPIPEMANFRYVPIKNFKKSAKFGFFSLFTIWVRNSCVIPFPVFKWQVLHFIDFSYFYIGKMPFLSPVTSSTIGRKTETLSVYKKRTEKDFNLQFFCLSSFN